MRAQILKQRVANFLLGKKGFILACTVMLLIVGVFLVQTFGKAYREGGYDFTSYLLSSTALFNGTNPYATGSPFPFIYPLFLCIALFPLTVVPYWFSIALWFIANVVALYFSGCTLLKLLSDSLSHKEIVALCLVPFVILINVIQNNLLNGQINFIVLLLSVLFLKYYLDSRKLLAIVLLSVAISIKLTPLVLVLYLIARKDFRSAALALLFVICLALGLPYAVAGENSIDWYSHYIRTVFVDKIVLQSQASDGITFSITSMIVSLVPSLLKIFSVVIAAVISIVPIVWAQISSPNDNADKQVHVFSLYMLAILLINPVSEAHHLINLFPAVSLITFMMLLRARRHLMAGMFTLIIVVFALITGRYYDAANIIGVVALYALILWIYFQENEPMTTTIGRSFEMDQEIVQ